MAGKFLRILLLVLVFAVYYFVVTKQPVSFDPRWHSGQTWKVQAFSRRPAGSAGTPYVHDIWEFKVARKKPAGAKTDFLIIARKTKDDDTGPNPVYTLEFRQPDMVLLSMSTSGSVESSKQSAPIKGAFLSSTREPSLLPLDFSLMPVFRLSRVDQARNSSLTQSKFLYRDGPVIFQLAEFTQNMAAGHVVRTLTLELAANLGAHDQVRNLQVWEPGKPWWSGAKRWHNGVLESEAILIEY